MNNNFSFLSFAQTARRRLSVFLRVMAMLAGAASPAFVHAQAEPVGPAVAMTPTSGDSEGNWRFVTRASAQLAYSDNLFIQSTNEKSDFSFHLAPTLAFGIGQFRSEFAPFSSVPHLLVTTGEEGLPERDFGFMSYTPEMVLFDKYSSENSFNHDLRIAGMRQSDLLTLTGDLHYQNYSDANIDVGRRLRQVAYTANGGAEYAVTGKLSAGLRLYGTHQDYAGGLSSTEGRLSLYGSYQLAPKTRLGVGETVGRLDVDSGGDQTYHRPWLELKYTPTAKLSFGGQAGEEFRYYPGLDSRSQFVYAVNGSYEASEATLLRLESRREVQSSAQYAGENIVGAVYQASIRQRFLSRNFFNVSGGFTHNRYQENQITSGVARTDKYQIYKAGVARDITSRGTIELSYEYRKNDSTLSNFGFDENVVTLSGSFLF